jgi:hypothetical protein
VHKRFHLNWGLAQACTRMKILPSILKLQELCPTPFQDDVPSGPITQSELNGLSSKNHYVVEGTSTNVDGSKTL